MNDHDFLLLNLNKTIDRLQKRLFKINQIIDEHIKHYEDLGHQDTVLKFKKLRDQVNE